MEVLGSDLVVVIEEVIVREAIKIMFGIFFLPGACLASSLFAKLLSVLKPEFFFCIY